MSWPLFVQRHKWLFFHSFAFRFNQARRFWSWGSHVRLMEGKQQANNQALRWSFNSRIYLHVRARWVHTPSVSVPNVQFLARQTHLFLPGKVRARRGSPPPGRFFSRSASVSLARRNMNEALNQDTGPHESRRRLSWRRGMGPSVAAYEWLTDSQCFWHQLKECEEVAKIRAAARCTSSPQSKTSKPKYARAPFVTLTFYKIAGRRGGGAAAFFFSFPETWKIFTKIHPLHLYSFSRNCLPSFFLCENPLSKESFSPPPIVLCFECLVTAARMLRRRVIYSVLWWPLTLCLELAWYLD